MCFWKKMDHSQNFSMIVLPQKGIFQVWLAFVDFPYQKQHFFQSWMDD